MLSVRQSNLQFTHLHSIVVAGIPLGVLLGAWLQSICL
jgi:hypothetical protein